MEVLVKIAQFVMSLSLLIIAHECGHFFFAKLFGVRVEKFYLFFNPGFSLFRKKIGDTEYGIGWLPLGGYVKISGMIDESMDREQMAKPPKPWEFRSKPTWQRLLIMIGGVTVNFLLALGIYSMILFTWGETYLPNQNVRYGVVCDSLALKAGFLDGDQIISIDGEPVVDFGAITPRLVMQKTQNVEVLRENSTLDIPIPSDFSTQNIRAQNVSLFQPRYPIVIDSFASPSVIHQAGMMRGDSVISINGQPVSFIHQLRDSLKEYEGQQIVLGFIRDTSFREVSVTVPSPALLGFYTKGMKTKKMEYGFFESIPAGIRMGVETSTMYLRQLRLLFAPETKAYESLGGFITIGSVFPGIWNWYAFWQLTAFLSIMLAIMNILPIPALDGGHVLFLLYEMITGRKPSQKFMEYAQLTGMFLIFFLIIVANGNDLIKLFQ